MRGLLTSWWRASAEGTRAWSPWLPIGRKVGFDEIPVRLLLVAVSAC